MGRGNPLTLQVATGKLVVVIEQVPRYTLHVLWVPGSLLNKMTVLLPSQAKADERLQISRESAAAYAKSTGFHRGLRRVHSRLHLP